MAKSIETKWFKVNLQSLGVFKGISSEKGWYALICALEYFRSVLSEDEVGARRWVEKGEADELTKLIFSIFREEADNSIRDFRKSVEGGHHSQEVQNQNKKNEREEIKEPGRDSSTEPEDDLPF